MPVLTIGQVLQNRYQVLSVLGHGDEDEGAGAVYQVYDQRLGIDCVVKELRVDEHASQPVATAAQFWQETAALMRLTHPDLPRITDYFQENGAFYLVTDLVTGKRLQSLIGKGMPEADVLNIADQLLDVLQYLHSQGVAHGDIKPANVIIGPGGHAMLVDLGPASMVHSVSDYAPPERDTDGMDVRGDIYALGATLYHALTGHVPTRAQERVRGAALKLPREINNAISLNTEQAIVKSLALSPGRRFQSANEFHVALRGTNVQADEAPTTGEEPTEATTAVLPQAVAETQPVSHLAPHPALPPRSRRTRPLAILAVIVGLLLLAGVIFIAAQVVSNLAALTPLALPTVGPTAPVGGTALATTAASTAAATLAALRTDTPSAATSSPAPELTNTPLPKPNCQQGQAAITSPTSGAILHGAVPVMGTASCDGFGYYKFEFVDQRCQPLGLCFVAGKFAQPVSDGQLMNWDTTRTWDGQPMPNGTYVLRLTVVGQDESPLPQKAEITITIDNH